MSGATVHPITRLKTCRTDVADEDRMSHVCYVGHHEKCTGLIMQARSHLGPIVRLCDCPDPACTCRARGLGKT